MIRKTLLLSFLVLILTGIFQLTISAHPGKTDSNGCHTCWTNCEIYGLEYGEYHCHNSSSNTTSNYNSSIPETNTQSNNSNNYSIELDQEDYIDSLEMQISGLIEDRDYYKYKYLNTNVELSNKKNELNNLSKKYKNIRSLYICILIISIISIISLLTKRNEKKNLIDEIEKKNQIIKKLNIEKKQIDLYINNTIQTHIDDWFAERYKGRLNPYTNRPILSEKDFNDYLEEYKKRHDGETPM